MEDRTIICRCSDVTLEDIRKLLSQGYNTVDEIKRICRLGMGPCGGKTCTNLVINEIVKAKGSSLEEVAMPNFRPPAKNIKLELLSKAGGNDEELR